MVTITQANLFSNVWRTIYNLLKDNVTDPNARGKIWVYGSFPDVTGSRFPSYPILVVKPINVSDEKLSFKGGVRQDSISIFIKLYSNDAVNLDVVFDDVRNQLRTNESSLITDGLRNMRINSTVPLVIVIGGEDIHVSVMEVRFNHV